MNLLRGEGPFGYAAIEKSLMVAASIGRRDSRGQRMALYMIRVALRIDTEKISATNAKTVEKRSEAYTHRGIHSPLEFRVSYRHKNVCT